MYIFAQDDYSSVFPDNPLTAMNVRIQASSEVRRLIREMPDKITRQMLDSLVGTVHQLLGHQDQTIRNHAGNLFSAIVSVFKLQTALPYIKSTLLYDLSQSNPVLIDGVSSCLRKIFEDNQDLSLLELQQYVHSYSFSSFLFPFQKSVRII